MFFNRSSPARARVRENSRKICYYLLHQRFTRHFNSPTLFSYYRKHLETSKEEREKLKRSSGACIDAPKTASSPGKLLETNFSHMFGRLLQWSPDTKRKNYEGGSFFRGGKRLNNMETGRGRESGK